MQQNSSRHKSQWIHGLLLLGWIALGLSLRLANLAGKSPSSTEISTLGFSLGHGFLGVPLDRLISLHTLLSPLQVTSNTSPGDVIHRLIGESNHPPLYFVLTHFWLQLFSPPGTMASLWVGRSLSAILGVASIPAMFGLGWLAFRSRTVAQITAALMAVSPYGIYLAQEARHYTLTILWLIGSVCCLVVAGRCISQQKPLPVWIACNWIIVNGLGMATHYFFCLALGAEGLVIGWLWLRDWRLGKKNHLKKIRTFAFPHRGYWRLVYGVAVGTAIAGLVWLPVLIGIPNTDLAHWNGELDTNYGLGGIWQPLVRLLAWWITMIFLLPVEGVSTGVGVVSGVIVLGVLLWVFPGVIQGFRFQLASLKSRLSIQVLAGFLLSAIAIFLMIIYGLGTDLSLAARYHFVYFPTVMTLLGASLAPSWHLNGNKLSVTIDGEKVRRPCFSWFPGQGKKVVIVVLLLSFLGGLTVISNYGYQKSRRSDLLVAYIQTNSEASPAIAMTYKTHAELRSLMGLAVDFQRFAPAYAQNTQFLLIQAQGENSQISTLANNLNQIKRPLDLWGVNLKIEREKIEALNCSRDPDKPKINGYQVRLYHCK